MFLLFECTLVLYQQESNIVQSLNNKMHIRLQLVAVADNGIIVFTELALRSFPGMMEMWWCSGLMETLCKFLYCW